VACSSSGKFASVSLLSAAIQIAAPSAAAAQAWVPANGEGSVTVSYQNYYNTGHYDRSSRETPNGATHSKSVLVDVNYGLTDTLAISVNLPFVSAKYVGPRPSYFVGPFETFPGPLDDGASRSVPGLSCRAAPRVLRGAVCGDAVRRRKRAHA
jgi:hypothetical protein